MMSWLLTTGAWAGSDPSVLQAIHHLEWAREDPAALAAQIPGGDSEVRVAVARALGRLRTPAALQPLLGLSDDPEPVVRAEVAHALGATPGAAAAIRAWLARLPPPRTPVDRARAVDGERTRLVEGLGRLGDATDVPWLIAQLDHPWPSSAAAARALGRMGRRKVTSVEHAVPALVRALDRPDPRLVTDVAWALRSIGLTSAGEEEIAATRAAALRAKTGPARAWLVAAVWPRLTVSERGDLFVRAVTDPWRATRIAAFDAVLPHDFPPEILSTWLVDPDPWLVDAALHAVGRSGDAGAAILQAVADDDPDPWTRAEAVKLGAEASDDHPLVRAASIGQMRDRTRLVEIATSDPSAPARTAALDALDALGGDAPLGLALLASVDPAVREVALGWVANGEPKAVMAPILAHLDAEPDSDVWMAGLRAIDLLLDRDPVLVRATNPDLPRVLSRGAGSPSARVRRATADLAARMGQTWDAAPEDVRAPMDGPDLTEVRRIRGARIETDRGSFTIALDPDTAPRAVANFAHLVDQDFFDGLPFHRVVPGFVVQTGCPRGDGWGGPGWTLPDEPSALPFDLGAVGMARSDYDTGGSQWFVAAGPAPHLVGEYTRFGHVVRGLEVVTRIERGDRIRDIVLERIP